MVKISPSILSSDYGNLESELKKMEECGADMIHVDVMDGHFVPNITLVAPIVKCIRKATKLTFDVHLMISDPYKYVPDFAKAGSDIITFHTESDSDTEKTIDEILSLGKKAGLSVKPGTPIEEIYPYLDKLSLVLIMTVEPGFGGQRFMADQLPKISQLHERILEVNPACELEVDGGIDPETSPLVKQAGANVLVAGSAVFRQRDRAAAIAAIRNA